MVNDGYFDLLICLDQEGGISWFWLSACSASRAFRSAQTTTVARLSFYTCLVPRREILV